MLNTGEAGVEAGIFLLPQNLFPILIIRKLNMMMRMMMRTPRMIFATVLVSTVSCIVKNQEGLLCAELFETVKYLLPRQTGYQTVRRKKIMTTL